MDRRSPFYAALHLPDEFFRRDRWYNNYFPLLLPAGLHLQPFLAGFSLLKLALYRRLQLPLAHAPTVGKYRLYGLQELIGKLSGEL